jgi:L-alanine-DL-glutamate epimerase-like enolase superfamily enzyme
VVEQEITRAFYYGWYHELVDTPPPVENGSIRPPPGPGLGLALLPEVEKRDDATLRVTAAH